MAPRSSPHPGTILLDQILVPHEISQNALARSMGISPRRINEIVLGKRALTAATAVMLEEVLGIEARFWMSLQVEYEIARARACLACGPPRRRRPMPVLGPDVPFEESREELVGPWAFIERALRARGAS